ncbi:hypothetical protein VCRA2122O338_130111 [Vibrio crassostreae]|nr:hypothetical protein VCRA2122O338_130111 [Vibrio crassostreae]
MRKFMSSLRHLSVMCAICYPTLIELYRVNLDLLKLGFLVLIRFAERIQDLYYRSSRRW